VRVVLGLDSLETNVQATRKKPRDSVGDGKYVKMAAETDSRWVPIAVSADILDGTVVPAHLSAGAIAVWRSASGKLFANGDRCPHRGMRLSHGFVRGESLSCIYHGWRYGTDGACQKIPAHPAVEPPKTINCNPFPVAEANGVVWSALVRPAEEPTLFEGYEALRSLVIDASLEAISHACQGETAEGAVTVQLAGKRALLVMNSYGQDEVFVAVLVEAGLSVPDSLAVSTAVEALRRRAEAMGDAA
jgi:phenylpropionate dioxygenase-like ring-hydroxylating dioxygenase large terminal subunit